VTPDPALTSTALCCVPQACPPTARPATAATPPAWRAVRRAPGGALTWPAPRRSSTPTTPVSGGVKVHVRTHAHTHTVSRSNDDASVLGSTLPPCEGDFPNGRHHHHHHHHLLHHLLCSEDKEQGAGEEGGEGEEGGDSCVECWANAEEKCKNNKKKRKGKSLCSDQVSQGKRGLQWPTHRSRGILYCTILYCTVYLRLSVFGFYFSQKNPGIYRCLF